MVFKARKTKENAVIPTKAYTDPLGYDFYTPEDISIAPGKSIVVNTGVQIKFDPLPELFASTFRIGGFLWSKSGLSTKQKIEVGAGVIDPDYRGDVCIHLYNHGEEPLYGAAGSKIAQLVPMICPIAKDVVEVTEFDDVTERGESGFGSSGK